MILRCSNAKYNRSILTNRFSIKANLNVASVNSHVTKKIL
jgi:hypothetical protein